MSLVITKPKAYLIKPKDIDTTVDNLCSKLFNEYYLEIMARFLVEFCQELGDWEAFTKTQIVNYLEKEGYTTEKAFYLFTKLLVNNGFVVLSEADKKYRVTHEFVAACWDASPARPEKFSS